MTPHVTVSKSKGISCLTLSGRGDLNLLGREVCGTLAKAIEEVAGDDDVSAVVIQGAGERAFSAGVDLEEMKEFTPFDAEAFIRTLHRAAKGLLLLSVPVVASIRGPCLGGALELALACDIRIASEDAVFGLPEVKIGVPSVIEASLLPATIGLGRARNMILTGEIVKAEEALRIGLVDKVVPSVALRESALETAKCFRVMSQYILSVQKNIIANWMEMGEEEGAEYSIKAFSLCFATNHPREAMNAYLEKRKPDFRQCHG